MTDRDRNGVSERWSTRGDFNLNAGQTVDPDTETVELVFSQGGTPLYDVVLAPSGCLPLTSCFVQKGPDTCTKSWKFSDKEADVATAIGWKSGKFTQRTLAGTCGNKITFNLRSGKNATMIAPTPARLRQSIRIGDDCATALLTCTSTRTGLKCASTSP